MTSSCLSKGSVTIFATDHSTVALDPSDPLKARGPSAVGQFDGLVIQRAVSTGSLPTGRMTFMEWSTRFWTRPANAPSLPSIYLSMSLLEKKKGPGIFNSLAIDWSCRSWHMSNGRLTLNVWWHFIFLNVCPRMSNCRCSNLELCTPPPPPSFSFL